MLDKGLEGFSDKIRRKGLLNVLKRAFSIATSGIYSNVRLYRIEHDITGKIPGVELPTGFSMAVLRRDELDILLTMVGRKRLQTYRERIDDGMSCLAVLKNGEAAAFAWCSPGDVLDDILGIVIPMGEKEAYAFDALSCLDFRKKGLFFSLLRCLLDESKSKGFERVIATHNSGDIVNVFPKYGRAGIPVRITDVIDCRKILFLKKVRWSAYDGHLEKEE